MPRRTPPGRVSDIASAACEVFIAKGYRRTLMTDVADRLALSHATLYRYVESKDALLELAARYAMDPAADLDALVPLATPEPGAILGLIRTWIGSRGTFPALRAAISGAAPADASAELGAIIDELYDFIEGSQVLLRLLESLTDDYPGLGGDAVVARKDALTERLAGYLAERSASGALRPLPDPVVAAHFLGESIAWFAQHRKRDPRAASIDDAQAHAAVRSLLLAAFVPDTDPLSGGDS